MLTPVGSLERLSCPTPANTAVLAPGSCFSLLLEEELFSRATHQPVAFIRCEEVELLHHEIHAVLVGVSWAHLKRAVALPHAPLGGERLDHRLRQRHQVGVRWFLLPQRVERSDLDHYPFVLRYLAEGINVGIADGTAGADAAQMVDDDRRIRVLRTHTVQFGEVRWVDEAAHSLVRLRPLREHRRVALRLQPFFSLGESRENAERADAFGGEFAHPLDRFGLRVDDGRADEHFGVELDHVQHVRVVEPVVAHLDEVDARDAGRLGVFEQVLRRERRRLHVVLFEAGREWVVSGVWSPDMDMRVYVIHRTLISSSHWLVTSRTGFACDSAIERSPGNPFEKWLETAYICPGRANH